MLWTVIGKQRRNFIGLWWLCELSDFSPPVLNGLRHMRRGNPINARKIRDRTRDLQDSMIAASGKIQSRDGLLQQIHGRVLGGGELFHLLWCESSVGKPLPRELPVAGGLDTFSNRLAGFASGFAGQIIGRKSWHFNVQIDAIEQGS